MCVVWRRASATWASRWPWSSGTYHWPRTFPTSRNSSSFRRYMRVQCVWVHGVCMACVLVVCAWYVCLLCVCMRVGCVLWVSWGDFVSLACVRSTKELSNCRSHSMHKALSNCVSHSIHKELSNCTSHSMHKELSNCTSHSMHKELSNYRSHSIHKELFKLCITLPGWAQARHPHHGNHPNTPNTPDTPDVPQNMIF